MELPELREELHKYISKADKNSLKIIYAISKEVKKATIIGYDTDGSPITQQELIKRAKRASERVKAGDFITQEDIEKEIKNW